MDVGAGERLDAARYVKRGIAFESKSRKEIKSEANGGVRLRGARACMESIGLKRGYLIDAHAKLI